MKFVTGPGRVKGPGQATVPPAVTGPGTYAARVAGIDRTTEQPVTRTARHPRSLGWTGAAALAMGGSNQSLFLLTGLIATQGGAAIWLLALGLLLSWAAAPGWTELTLMWPDRVGGIAATCAEAFRRYNPMLSNLTGVCYWWGWVPTCGLTALLSAHALHDWYLPGVPVMPMAVAIVLAFAVLNVFGISRVELAGEGDGRRGRDSGAAQRGAPAGSR